MTDDAVTGEATAGEATADEATVGEATADEATTAETAGPGHVDTRGGTRDGARWLVLVVKAPAEPSRHRVAVWRELRRIGALSLGQGVWAVPDVPVFGGGIARALELTERAGGEAMSLAATGRGAQDGRRLREMFTAARSADWAEFLADCGKFEEEVAKEIRIAKFTLAELEEEEQSLERLRRWHRDLTARDVFGAPEAARAAERLKGCVAVCEDYAERVFAALHQAGAE